jgi:hypothetical protein
MKKLFLGLLVTLLTLTGCNKASDVNSEKETKMEEQKGEEDKESIKSTAPMNEDLKQSILPLLVEKETVVDAVAPKLADPTEMKQLERIMDKMKIGIQTNYEWYAGYLQSAKAGEPLPYHKNFGISQDEYNTFLQATGKVKLEKYATGTIKFVPLDNHVYEIEVSKNFKELDKIQVDLVNNTVKTKYGVATYDGKIEASDDQKLTGRWSGEEWRLHNDKARFIFSFGKLEESNKAILRVIIETVDNGKLLAEEYFMMYEL